MTTLQLQPDEIPEPGGRALLMREGLEIALFHVEGRILAIGNHCPHAGGALCNGRLDGHVVQCPAHGLRFDLRNGAMPGNPGLSVPSYAVREEGGHYMLDVPPAEGSGARES
jgi:nitrite reductase/ring-hydroxylating ferredoxin subunit